MMMNPHWILYGTHITHSHTPTHERATLSHGAHPMWPTLLTQCNEDGDNNTHHSPPHTFPLE